MTTKVGFEGSRQGRTRAKAILRGVSGVSGGGLGVSGSIFRALGFRV